jgi:hypothetical protein
MAMEGDLAAAKLYFSYTAGKPQDAIDPDRVDVHELEIYRDTAPLKTESATLTEAGLPEPQLHLIRTMRPMMSALMYKQVASIMDPRKNRTPADQGKHPPSPNGTISAKPPSPNGSISAKPPSPNGSISAKPPRDVKPPLEPLTNGRTYP